MGDFPAVRQLVAQAVSPVLAGAPSPAPAPPLYPLPLDAARIAATAAAADAMDGVPPLTAGSAAARHVRSRGPRPRYSPSAEDQRPQLGGELGLDLLQHQVDQLAAHEGDCFLELSLDEVAAKIAAHMRRPQQEIVQKAELLEHCMQRAVQRSTREVVRRQLQRSMQGDGQQEDREDEDDYELDMSQIRGLSSG